MRRRTMLGMSAAVCAGGWTRSILFAQEGHCATSHTQWVADALKRMETMMPGMSRPELGSVFTTEGGLATALQRTYVSRDCPYFKVDVRFRRADWRALEYGTFLDEYEDDRIVSISRPYLQFTIAD